MAVRRLVSTKGRLSLSLLARSLVRRVMGRAANAKPPFLCLALVEETSITISSCAAVTAAGEYTASQWPSLPWLCSGLRHALIPIGKFPP